MKPGVFLSAVSYLLPRKGFQSLPPWLQISPGCSLLWLISLHHHFHLCNLVNHKPLRGTDRAIMISRGFFKCCKFSLQFADVNELRSARLQQKFGYCSQRFPGSVRSRTVFTEGSLTLCLFFIDYSILWPAYLTLYVISNLACLLETREALCEMKAT